MARQGHVDILIKGPTAWNEWRKRNPEIHPDLSHADLRKTDLTGVRLAGVNLEEADLTSTIGLRAWQLSGTNLSGAKLPKEVCVDGGLAQVAAISKNAQKIFTLMMLGCIYSLLTIATTTDVRLLTNSASSSLPVIQAEIPIVGFY